MRSNTDKSNKKRNRASSLSIIAASFTLVACAVDQNQSLTMVRPLPYLAVSALDEMKAANARRSGSFGEENGCVVFRPADNAPAVTPVFARGETALATDGVKWLGLFVNGDAVSLDEVYHVRGAELASGGAIALATPAPAGCPSTYFVVRHVSKALADANASRFCAGVIICRSFGLN